MTNVRPVHEFVLNALHIALGAFLLPIALLAHGRLPGLSADASAALGFLVFFGLGIPALLVGLGTFFWSLFAPGQRFVALAMALVVTGFLVLVNVWTGVVASLGYISFAVWAYVERLRCRSAAPRM